MKTASCIQTEHIKWEDEPSLVLSDADFVHRMWESDEESDDEESSATSCDDASDEMGSVVEGRSVSQSTLQSRRTLGFLV